MTAQCEGILVYVPGMFLPLLVLFTHSAFAVVFGNYDRVDTPYASALAQTLGRSVPAMVQKSRLENLSEGKFRLRGVPLSKFNLCSEEKFAEESIIANCSASFIGKDLVLTAAHCFNDHGYTCDSYSVVFDINESLSPWPNMCWTNLRLIAAKNCLPKI